MSLADIPDEFLPEDESDPSSVRRHHLRVAVAAWLSLLLFMAFVLPALSIGLPRIGAVAWSTEVDSKIKKAIDPVNAKLDDVDAKLQDIIDGQNKILAAQLADRLRQLRALRCKTTGEDRTRFDIDIEEAQHEYRKLTGERYPLPVCGE